MASDNTSEIIGVDTFAQTLDLVLSNIVFKVKAQQATAELPLHVEKEWIMRRVCEQINEYGYTIQPKSIDTPNGLGPFFSMLPQELRDIILADCLSSGYPQFMASSRAMRKEGLGQISEKGVFRMNFGIMVRLNLGSNVRTGTSECPPLLQEIANNIQNLSVRVKETSRSCREFWTNMDLDILKQFGGPDVPRKSCKILLQLNHGANAIGTKLLAVLKTFVGFKYVELRILTHVKPFPDGLTESQKDIEKGYEICRNRWSPTLGFGSMGQDEGDLFMSFNPRRA